MLKQYCRQDRCGTCKKYDLVKAEIHRLLPSAFRQADDPDIDEVIKNIIEICDTEGAG